MRRGRSGVTATDVLTLASGAALAADTTHARRLVAMLRTGVAATTDTGLHLSENGQ